MELTRFQEEIKEEILNCPAPGKNAARSALHNLERAWLLKDVDPEMAFFRSITGEEESARAVFLSLKRRRYVNSEKLSLKSHLQKTALHPFLLAIEKSSWVDSLVERNAQFLFGKNEFTEHKKRLRFRFQMEVVTSEKGWVYPLPPLEVSLKKEDNSRYDFQSELQEIAGEKKAKTAYDYVKRLSRRRENILYAQSEGIPKLESPIEPFLVYRQSAIFANLMVFLMIDPYKENQTFVQQSLDAFLKLLGHFPVEEFVREQVNSSFDNSNSCGDNA